MPSHSIDENDLRIISESMVTISVQYPKACITIEAYDDEILEGTETFVITVNASNPLDVVIGNSSVIISDNDGE